MNRFVFYSIVLFFLAGGMVLLFPSLDLFISGLFYSPQEGFFLRDYPIFYYAHLWVQPVTIGMVVVLVVGILFSFFQTPLKPHRKNLIYILLVLALGPGLLVNAIFKDQWGRARPSQTEIFGGTKIFTPPFVPVKECDKNCSFVSGDASVGFFFVVFALLYGRKRPYLHALPLVMGGFLGLTRIVQGAHFFSDVMFCGGFVLMVSYGLYTLMYPRAKP